LLSALHLWCLKVQGWGWWSSRFVSAGTFFLDFFCGGIVSFSSAEIRWAPMLGVSESSIRFPRTQKWEGAVTRSSAVKTGEETKSSTKSLSFQ
jgi:hypothetical protein